MKEHAWKLIPPTLIEARANPLTHIPSTTSRNSDTQRSVAVSHDVCSVFGSYLTQFRHRMSLDLPADVVYRCVRSKSAGVIRYPSSFRFQGGERQDRGIDSTRVVMQAGRCSAPSADGRRPRPSCLATCLHAHHRYVQARGGVQRDRLGRTVLPDSPRAGCRASHGLDRTRTAPRSACAQVT